MKAKPCPFCQQQETFIENNGGGKDGVFWVECKCAAEGPVAGTEEAAIIAWNTRPREQELIQALERLSKELDAHVRRSNCDQHPLLFREWNEADRLVRRFKSE